ncbi:MAG: pentapeptide repeat-containing protein [Cyanobacteria bacterium P01_A01_bin.84]
MNFSKQNIQGRSFKEQNLTGANFSGSDIRGADFTGANLTNADFSYVKTGLNNSWIILSFLLSLIIGFLGGSLTVFIVSDLFSQDIEKQVSGAIALIGWIAFSAISIQEGFANAFLKVVRIVASVSIFAGIISTFSNNLVIGDIAIFIATNFSLSIFVVCIITACLSFIIAVTSTKAVTCCLIVTILTAILLPLTTANEAASEIANKLPVVILCIPQ